MATIVDVARLAGVSASSVSNYLNGRYAKMTVGTLERIRRAISELDYRPSRVARQLKTGHVSVIGLLVPSVANPFFGEIATAIQRAAQARGYQVILCNTFRAPEREKDFAEELAAFGARGFITGSSLLDPQYLASLVSKDFPIVAFEGNAAASAALGVHVVSVDNSLATSLAVEHLVALGHRRIAYVTVPPQTAARAARAHGFRSTVQRLSLGESAYVHEISLPPAEFGDDMIAELGVAAANAIATMHERPTALIAMNDMLAIGLAAGLRAQGLAIPEDISLVGIDDLFLARLMNPPMTSVRQPLTAMADAAIDCLINEADRGEAVESRIFAPELVERQSTIRHPG